MLSIYLCGDFIDPRLKIKINFFNVDVKLCDVEMEFLAVTADRVQQHSFEFRYQSCQAF